MLKSYEVYSESFLDKVKSIANVAGRGIKLAANTLAPELMEIGGRYKQNINYVLGKSASPAEQKSLMSSLPMEFIRNPNLNSKYQLAIKPEFDILGLVDPNNESAGYKMTFKGNAKLYSGDITTIPGDHYIIVKMNGSNPQTDGKLYSLSRRNQLIENQQYVYSQKNILLETKKLVDLKYKRYN